MESTELCSLVSNTVDELKGTDIVVLDLRERCSFTDYMIIATGTSDRHTKAVVSKVSEKVKGAGLRPQGIEDSRDGGWVLLDLGDVLLHLMKADVRAFYNLEKLWAV